MSDIFISYANEDRSLAQRLAEALSQQGWSIFWDRTIPVGKTWREVIGAELELTRCIVVLWSESSIASDWVHEEADEGRERGVLVPVLIEAVRPPIGFRSLQTADLSGWDGDGTTVALQSLITDIGRLLEPLPVEAGRQDPTKPEEDVKQKPEPQQKRQAEADQEQREAKGVREADQDVRQAAEPDQQVVARPEVDSPPPAQKPSVWERASSAKWFMAAGLVLLIASGVVFFAYQRTASFHDTLSDGSEGPEMVVLPAGSFMMGSPDSDEAAKDNEKPQREVTIAQPFAVGKYEVTFDEWDACVAGGGCNEYSPEDETWGRGPRPVINVSWKDAQAYVAWLSAETREHYRLLSEAEWEYAARAGTPTRYSFGDKISGEDANFRGELGQTIAVGSYPANPWGLHDMHGNVWEWVEDCWNARYDGAPTDGSAWPSGYCLMRVLRGGSWYEKPSYLRSASRLGFPIDVRHENFGFRVARTLP